MPEDRIYQTPRHPVSPFVFDVTVANVFDDMIRRSIPLYEELIRQQARMIEQLHRPKTRIYDLGCSTGNLVLALLSHMPDPELEIVAVDNSRPMLEVFSRRLETVPARDRVILLQEDIRHLPLRKASVVVVNFTLQFISPADRDSLFHRIYEALIPGGILLLSEKTIHSDPDLADLQIAFYYRFKRENGYSELEISQKREALETVLIPESIPSHHDRMRRFGFKAVDPWLKWFNFCSWICRK